MDWKEVIKNLKYLISEDCTDTQFDYADEIEIAIRVMESQEDLSSKIDKAIEEINDMPTIGYYEEPLGSRPMVFKDDILTILKRNIGE